MKAKALVSFSALLWAAPAVAQTCIPGQSCNYFDAAEIIQARVGIGLAGGNPIPGSSSTQGIRLGKLPRMTLAARVTGVRLSFPNLETQNTNDELSGLAHSFNLDAAVGIFSGLSLLPTVGGFASIDLLASYGKLSLSDDDDFLDDPSSWAAGVRLGILRESFTAPGVAVTAMYRQIGDYRHRSGEPEVDAGVITRLEDNSVLSFRGTVGKRVLMLGAVAGIGYDRFSSDAQLFAFTASPTQELTNSRTTLFANLSWTMLLLHIVGEGGIQQGGNENAFYGSLAFRLAL